METQVHTFIAILQYHEAGTIYSLKIAIDIFKLDRRICYSIVYTGYNYYNHL